MIVIKLGGSLVLSGMLKSCLDKVEQDYQGRPVVIVPGGGVFADQVRRSQQQWQFDDRTAHQMAILAMQQMALLFKSLKPGFSILNSIAEFSEQIQRQNPCKNFFIWSPNVADLDKAGVPSSWDITSDSLSAWLAKSLGADGLIVVKSVNIEQDSDILKLVQQKVVDASFYEYTEQVSFEINIVNAEKFTS
jgi:5-(aminomethyl)-3-furanmethanol phosphate kinase